MLGKIEGGQRVRRLDGITNPMDMDSSQLLETVEDRGVWCASGTWGHKELDTTQWLNNNTPMTWDQETTVSYCFSAQKGTTAKPKGGKKQTRGKFYLCIDTHSGNRGADLLGGPVVKTPCFPAVGTGSIPGWGSKIPHATQSGKKKQRQRSLTLAHYFLNPAQKVSRYQNSTDTTQFS